jgi:hypothetical protein
MGSRGADNREAAKGAKTDAKKCGRVRHRWTQMNTDGMRVSRGMSGPPRSPRSSSTAEITKTTEATKGTERKFKNKTRRIQEDRLPAFLLCALCGLCGLCDFEAADMGYPAHATGNPLPMYVHLCLSVATLLAFVRVRRRGFAPVIHRPSAPGSCHSSTRGRCRGRSSRWIRPAGAGRG